REGGGKRGFQRESDLETAKAARPRRRGATAAREPDAAAAVRSAAEDFFDLVTTTAGVPRRSGRTREAEEPSPNPGSPARLRFDPAAAGPRLEAARERLLAALDAARASL